MARLLLGFKVETPKLQGNVKAFFLPIIFLWLVLGRLFGFYTIAITIVLSFFPPDNSI